MTAQTQFADNATTALGAAIATTPAAGTSEAWLVTSTAAPMPAVTTGISQFIAVITPGPTNTTFGIAGSPDPTPEVVLITNTNNGTHFQVQRGYGGTIKTHQSGDILTVVVSAAWPTNIEKMLVSNPTTPAAVGLLWSDEFTEASMSYATDAGGGTWRTKPHEAGGSVLTGYTDFAALSWNCTAIQAETAGVISVASSVLSIKAMRNPGGSLFTGISNLWIGAQLESNFNNGLVWHYGYFEWRMQLPNPSRGMFPALWLFNGDVTRANATAGAEVDVLEVFGFTSGNPWNTGVHFLNGGLDATFADGVSATDNTWSSVTAIFVAGDVGKVITGINIPLGTTIATRIDASHITLSQATTGTGTARNFTIVSRGITTGESVYSASDDVVGWHRYGVDWQANHITFYKDGVVTASVSAAGVAWFKNAIMGIRMDYVMDPNFVGATQQSTPTDPVGGTQPTMNIDYVRVYSAYPAGMPTGSADPLAALSPVSSPVPSALVTARQNLGVLTTGEAITPPLVSTIINNDADHEFRLALLEQNPRHQFFQGEPIRIMDAIAGATVAVDQLFNAGGSLKYELSPDGNVRADGQALSDPVANHLAGVFIGQLGGNRRVVIVNGNAGQDVQLDNNGGTFRLLQNGGSRLEANTNQVTFKAGRVMSTVTTAVSSSIPLTAEMVFVTAAGATTQTLPSAVTAGVGASVHIRNTGAGTVTLASAAGTLDVTSLAAAAKVHYISDGTNWWSA